MLGFLPNDYTVDGLCDGGGGNGNGNGNGNVKGFLGI